MLSARRVGCREGLAGAGGVQAAGRAGRATGNHSPKTRVSDPHRFNADPDTDPDPAFFLIADPDPGFDDLKLKKIHSWKFNFYFLDQKLQFTYP